MDSARNETNRVGAGLRYICFISGKEVYPMVIPDEQFWKAGSVTEPSSQQPCMTYESDFLASALQFGPGRLSNSVAFSGSTSG